MEETEPATEATAGSARTFPRRLTHEVPPWVDVRNAVYHIRIRSAVDLLREDRAAAILESVHHCTGLGKWWARLFLIMPDHLHALISFDPQRSYSRVIADWKHWHRTHSDIEWQENFFDHRVRSHESLSEKMHYIRENPVRAGLCDCQDGWPWWTTSEQQAGQSK